MSSNNSKRPLYCTFNFDVIGTKDKDSTAWYNRIKTLIRSFSVKDSDSAYVVLIGQVGRLQTLLEPALEEGRIRYKIRALHNSEDDVTAQDVEAGFHRELKAVETYIKKKIEENVKAKRGPQLQKSQARQLRKRLLDVEAAIAIFGLTGDFEGVLKELKKTAAEEMVRSGINPKGGRFKAKDVLFQFDDE